MFLSVYEFRKQRFKPIYIPWTRTKAGGMDVTLPAMLIPLHAYFPPSDRSVLYSTRTLQIVSL